MDPHKGANVSTPSPEEQVEELAAELGASAPYQEREVFLTPMGMFATPESVSALESYVTSIPNDGERTIAITVMGMTWNLCAKLVASSG